MARYTPGMRVKPIEPDKYYKEAPANAGDRVVHRLAGDTVHFVDIVAHDDIGKYGKKRWAFARMKLKLSSEL